MRHRERRNGLLRLPASHPGRRALPGQPGAHGLPGAAGVWGANLGSGPGVLGTSNGGGAGIHGVASSGGTGVYAENASSSGGTALQVIGPAAFNRSGIATIAAGSTSVTIGVAGGLTTSSLVLALLQNALPGIYVASAVPNPSTGQVTIHLNAAPGTPAKVAFFVVN